MLKNSIVLKSGIKKLASFVSATLVIGTAVAISSPSANAVAPVGIANTNATVAAGLPTTLNVALTNAASAIAVTNNTATAVARSVGLAVKDATTATAQTATVSLGGTLSLYWLTATSTAISADGGTWSSPVAPTATITTGATAVAFAGAAASATANTQAVLWTAPATSGTYVIKSYRANHPGISTDGLPTAINPLAGVLFGQITVTVGGSHPSAAGTNAPDTLGTANSSLFVAVATNTTGDAVIHPTTTLGTGEDSALSRGLVYKDSSFGTAQTATVLASAKLSLYALVSTAAAFSATGGSFASSRGMNNTATATYGSDLRSTIITGVSAENGSSAVATIWTAPSVAGTYTVNFLTGFVANSAGVSQIPSYTNGLPSTLSGKITVTVIAASAGGSYSATFSACNTATSTAAVSATYPSGVDSTTSVVANGGDWYIDFNIKDAYGATLPSGNIVTTATNGAFVNIGTTSGTAPVVGTASTDVEFANGTGETVRISQPTDGAPLTTTVTITYNGTTVCTKTVTIAGHASKLVVANVGTQNLNTPTGAGSVQWMYQQIGLSSAGLFTVLATDSAGNIVTTPTTYGAFSADAATLTTTVQGMVFPTLASSTSSSSAARFALGSFACGASAGEANVKVKFTIAATGTVLSSDAFKARCAGTATTYVASLDKASYVQGELAKLTIAWKDSKGFAANNITAVGANTMSLPYMTGVTTGALTGANPASHTAVIANADGTSTYTLTVGTTSGLTAGTYTGVVEFTAPALGVTSTPTYKLTTGADTTSNADVLKSIVALIASINKQIQALQKLILARR